MPNRFPPLAPQEPIRNRSMARALPAPSAWWVDFLGFAILLCGIRLL